MTTASQTLPRYLTTAQAAELLLCAADKITDWIHSGQLPAVDISTHQGGKARWRIAAADLEAFLASRRSSPAPKSIRHQRKQGFKRRYYQ